MLTMGQRRSWARHGAREIEATIDAALAQQEAQRKADRVAAKAAAAERDKPVPYTTEQLRAATHIRTRSGWKRVVRVNAKSVTTAGNLFYDQGSDWTDRYVLAKVLEVRTIEAKS